MKKISGNKSTIRVELLYYVTLPSAVIMTRGAKRKERIFVDSATNFTNLTRLSWHESHCYK
jgi:hypothetical protein